MEQIQRVFTSRSRSEEVRSASSFAGCRGGILTGTILVGSVLVLNLILAVFFSVTGEAATPGFRRIYAGDCEKVKKKGLWLHLGINVLSSLMLGASNYAMQVATSPTRKEVDRVHAQGGWLDIGVPSIKNVFHVTIIRRIIFAAMLLSSLPLHFVYNSAVFSTIRAYDYEWFIVSPSYFRGTPANATYSINDSGLHADGTGVVDGGRIISATTVEEYLESLAQKKTYNASNWRNISADECVSRYRDDFSVSHRNVILVTKEDDLQNSLWDAGSAFIYTSSFGRQSDWICGAPVTTKLLPIKHAEDSYDTIHMTWFNSTLQTTLCDPTLVDSRNWTFATRGILPKGSNNFQFKFVTISHCLSEEKPQHCTLNFSQGIMAIVCFCNMIKFVGMMYLFFTLNDRPLVTIGDAMASFLERSDENISGTGVIISEHFKQDVQLSRTMSRAFEKPPRIYWYNSVSKWRLWSTHILYLSAMLCIFALFPLALQNDSALVPISFKALWGRGFGAVNGVSLLSFRNSNMSMLSLVLMANIPQFLISILYFSLNSILTCMILGREWNEYAMKHQPLRTTDPQGEQTNTYWLQLPYQFAIPLIVISSLLHWLASQAVFLAKISITNINGTYLENFISTLGYSCIAMAFLIILAVPLWMFFFGVGFIRYRPGLPPIRNNSRLIATLCHTSDEGNITYLKKVRWGEKVERRPAGKRCLEFSCFDVRPPQEGVVYE